MEYLWHPINLSACSMERILERYERYSNAERQLEATDLESRGSWSLQHAKLKARIEALERTQKHYMGEELGDLSLRELQNLEQPLDSALKHVRSRKNQLMFEAIAQLQKKDKALQDQNNILTKKVKEKEKEEEEVGQQNQGGSSSSSSSSDEASSSSYIASQHLTSLNVIRVGDLHSESYRGGGGGGAESGVDRETSINATEVGEAAAYTNSHQSNSTASAGLPPWMLSHLS
ncbi:OLC1v1011993C2 [Oldenlandia corymbosa var. corymbosa]|uniref:OLC1v1011993C2 n=1 Tax=Oldenlandia corymbosa var. corymbosa TaxID=529605 RepID=A0AAV1DUY6_OLDCO|nr:OLC1v1011993C2 [Oldenlandia corymbosa var. corymbosa]